ncbi:unnamed protein product, partial [Tetraodon nigroviridis]
RPAVRGRPRVSRREPPSPSPKPRTGLRSGRMMGSPGGARPTCSASSAPCCSPGSTNSPCACSAARRRWRRSRSASSPPGTGSFTRTATSGGRRTGPMALMGQKTKQKKSESNVTIRDGWVHPRPIQTLDWALRVMRLLQIFFTAFGAVETGLK